MTSMALMMSSDTTTNSVDFTLGTGFLADNTIQAALRPEGTSAGEMQIFLNALSATADEFDDVLRRLAD
jgi:hypothetical protein